MRASKVGVVASTDNSACPDEDRPHHRVRLDCPSASFCLGQSQIHPGNVGIAHTGEILSSGQLRVDQKGEEPGNGGLFGGGVSFLGAMGTGGGGLGPVLEAEEPDDAEAVPPESAGLNSSLG
jgi:hypothetical protein